MHVSRAMRAVAAQRLQKNRDIAEGGLQGRKCAPLSSADPSQSWVSIAQRVASQIINTIKSGLGLGSITSKVQHTAAHISSQIASHKEAQEIHKDYLASTKKVSDFLNYEPSRPKISPDDEL